ncbi:MAG TPA: hypothetical protein PLF26_16195, partial [Blastocatellia bacterium]|nr:hypothetical protein [Blastocatellia bacterium]
MALGPGGDVVLIGGTDSPLFPTVNGLLPFHNLPEQSNGADGFVAVLRADGQELVFSTFLGGVGSEDLQTVAVDGDRRVFVAGQTTTPDFPVVNAFQPAITNDFFGHGFVTVLSTSSSITPPSLERVVELRQPGKKYRLRIEGENLQPGLAVYIGADATPWPNAKLTSKGIVLESGRSLKSRFPAETPVSIRVVNADGGSSAINFTR